MNHLSGNVWISSNIRVLMLKAKTKGSQIMLYRKIDESRLKLIEFFTQAGQMVFNPRLQDGETLLAALSLNR